MLTKAKNMAAERGKEPHVGLKFFDAQRVTTTVCFKRAERIGSKDKGVDGNPAPNLHLVLVAHPLNGIL
jgi:hypothetical protein